MESTAGSGTAAAAAAAADDDRGLLSRLLETGRYCQDTPGGGVLHRPGLSVREISTGTSVHVAATGHGRLSAHVDRVSPLAETPPGGTCRYSFGRMVAHLASCVASGPDRRRQPGDLTIDLSALRAEPAHGPGRPLPRERLSVVDEAIHDLNSAPEPWTIQLEVRVGGSLDEDRLRAAVTAAAAGNPRARSRLAVPQRWRPGFEWEITEQLDVDAVDAVTCPDDAAVQAARSQFYSRPVSLLTSPPFRVRLVHHGRGDYVMLNLNHAAGDATAALHLLSSVARAYAAAADSPPADPEGPPAVEVRGPAGGWARARALGGELRGLTEHPVHVVPCGGSAAAGYEFWQLALDVDRTLALRGGSGSTVNDLLLAALHIAIDDWNRDHGALGGRIAVLMPVNLRPRHLWREVVGNFTFMLPVATRPRDRADPATAVAAVTKRTAAVKRRRSAHAVFNLLNHLTCLPTQAKQAIADLASRPEVMPTAILSNLGRIEAPPDFGLPVTEVWFSPPAKMPLGLSVGAATAGGQLHLVLRYRRPLFGGEEAAEFAQRYEEALSRVVRAVGVTAARAPAPTLPLNPAA